MRPIFILLLTILSLNCFSSNSDSAIVHAIYKEALLNPAAYKLLEELCMTAPKRLSGSEGAAKAVDLIYNRAKEIGYGDVYKQDVMVPHWVRGSKEEAWMLYGNTKVPLSVCALAKSIGTPTDGLKAKVIEVKNFNELESLGDKVKGHVVFFNFPMNPAHYFTFISYYEAARYRWRGANAASVYGAAGVVIRSLNLSYDDFPHTGSMANYDTLTPIPACAISTMGAEKLSEAIKKHDVQFIYKTSCKNLPDVASHNVIAEIKGSEYPDEIIVAGGHLDAWDLGEGAHDNGAGVVQTLEVIRLFKALNIKPRRTVRFVAFMDEEINGSGGRKYAAESKRKNENNIAAFESDGGAGSPRGFAIKGDSLQGEKIMRYKNLFLPFGVYDFARGYAGVDIDHLHAHGTLLIGLRPDLQRYFDYHHAATDTFDKIHQRELQLGAATIAAMVYLLSEYGVE